MWHLFVQCIQYIDTGWNPLLCVVETFVQCFCTIFALVLYILELLVVLSIKARKAEKMWNHHWVPHVGEEVMRLNTGNITNKSAINPTEKTHH